MTKVLILGGTGMLGSTVRKLLEKTEGIQSFSTSRYALNGYQEFEVGTGNIDSILDTYSPEYIINCIGVIKPHIDENSSESIANAIRINSIFPHQLCAEVNSRGIKVIQIATDCVFSGSLGNYNEGSSHDSLDVYGKSKSLGEVDSPNFMNIRVSIVGTEKGRSTSLLEWFLNQSQGATLKGYTNHFWNGVTTYQFAKICLGIISHNSFTSGKHHLVPSDIVTKFELLKFFSSSYERFDLTIEASESSFAIDRTLTTLNKSFNEDLWKMAGYSKVPRVEEMIREQAKN